MMTVAQKITVAKVTVAKYRQMRHTVDLKKKLTLTFRRHNDYRSVEWWVRTGMV